ncbi:hypothetical protein WNY37_06030 [Henriciella sp. AS95]|uniref:hypothetical protein n=1 Tax=Henriciella sp. AS95 TaxID=3135782 RepID=UPI0031712564
MTKLADFAARWADAGDGFRCWLGDVSDIPGSSRVTAIARQAGYAPHSDKDFFQIDRRTAARVMAYLQEQSLAHGDRRFTETRASEMLGMLTELGPSAQFWSNSRHSDFEDDTPTFTPDNAWMWIGLSDVCFDTGVIAFNDTTGFIFWVEEDD